MLTTPHPRPRLTVTTDVGTFTRQSTRPYTHVVVAGGRRAEWLEAQRLTDLANYRHMIECYRRGVGTDGLPFLQQYSPEQVQGWIDGYTQDIAKLEAVGPFTQDTVALWQATNWSSDKDRAIAVATSDELLSFRNVRVYEIATGKLVWQHVHQPMTPQGVMEHWARRRSIRRRRAGRRTIARY